MTAQKTYDPFLDIALGQVTGVTQVNKFGRNSVVTTAEDVWSPGGLWAGPTVTNGHQIHNIVSSSLLDYGAGSGARTVMVEGLGENWEEQSEAVALHATVWDTPVPTLKRYWRIYRMYITSAGTTHGTNAGSISATAADDGTVTAAIPALAGQTLMAIYTVPINKVAYLTGLYATANKVSGAAVGADVSLVSTGPADLTTSVGRTRFSWSVESTGTSAESFQRRPYPSFPEKTDIRMRVTAVSGTADISAGFDLILVDNPYPY